MSWNTYTERRIDLQDSRAVHGIRRFLEKFDLSYDGLVDYTVALYDGNETLVGTGSLRGEVLRNIAVDEDLQGEGVTGTIVSHLIREAANRNIYHYFIFTQPQKTKMFEGLGFTEIASARPYATILESGMGSIENYCDDIGRAAVNLSVPRAGIVVNCNPFTLGHKALIAKAAVEMPVIVFVVQEDVSLFPFDIRIKLVKEGLAEFDNVVVVPGGKYIISGATFPAYFTRTEDVLEAQTKLDATVFAGKIAGKLNIKRRYVGAEPYCQITQAYNNSLQTVLPDYGVEVKVIDRVSVNNGEIISASKVRKYIQEDNFAGLKSMVPISTYNYLMSSEAKGILERIKQSESRH